MAEDVCASAAKVCAHRRMSGKQLHPSLDVSCLGRLRECQRTVAEPCGVVCNSNVVSLADVSTQHIIARNFRRKARLYKALMLPQDQ